MAFYEVQEIQWHEGEEEMHRIMNVPEIDNPTQLYLTPHAGAMLVRSPLVAVGTLDGEGRPWTSLLGGQAGFARPVAESTIALKATVDREYDPVLQALLGKSGCGSGEVVRPTDPGKMISALALDLETRRRVKLHGRMVIGALAATETGIGEVQLVISIEQSLGNCPKYLNKKHIMPRLPEPKLVTNNFPLPITAIDLIRNADLFFISSSNHDSMDTNIRGGPKGFTRILSNDEDGLTIIWPEYSGNRFYQTLGNLKITPQAGLVIPDFQTGNVLYLSGTTEVLAGKAAAALIARTNLAVKMKVDALRFVSAGLPFRAQEGEPSPYNPPVRFLSSEAKNTVSDPTDPIFVQLVSKDIITPTVGRFLFRILEPKLFGKWKPGQWVALSFKDELDIGYSHMRDDDPKSINDDFLRTFTVSSRQDDFDGLDQFEITIRKVGPATDFLFRHNPGAELRLPIQGFGGEFYIEQSVDESISFVASGVGITPLLAQAADLNLYRLKLYWTVKVADLPLVLDSFDRIHDLAKSTKLFITGNSEEEVPESEKLVAAGIISIHNRRLSKEDLADAFVQKWYLCTSVAFTNTLLEWLAGENVSYEDFNY